MSCMGEKRNTYEILVEIPELKVQSFEKSKFRLNNNIKVNLTGIGWEGMDRVNLLQVRGNWRYL